MAGVVLVVAPAFGGETAAAVARAAVTMAAAASTASGGCVPSCDAGEASLELLHTYTKRSQYIAGSGEVTKQRTLAVRLLHLCSHH